MQRKAASHFLRDTKRIGRRSVVNKQIRPTTEAAEGNGGGWRVGEPATAPGFPTRVTQRDYFAAGGGRRK